MKNPNKFLMVGYGNVGQAIPERCEELGLVQSEYIVKSDGVYRKDGHGLEQISKQADFWQNDSVLKDVAVAFLSIPSFADGEQAYQIIKQLQAKNIAVITSEKGALANFYPELLANMNQLGLSATVGGGTRLLKYLSERVNPRTNQIHAVLNGTLNFIMHGISEGGTAGQVIDQAVTLGFAEPGATNHLEVINGEVIGDIPKKTAILWNVVMRPIINPKEFLQVDDLFNSGSKPQPVNQKSLNELISQASSRRFIVSIIKSSQEIPETDIIAGWRKQISQDWTIIGGFRRIDSNPLFRSLKIPGPGNGVVLAGGLNESDAVYLRN